MKGITIGVIALGLSFSATAVGSELISSASTAVSDDGKIIVAVHPYLTKQEANDIDYRRDGRIPVGILVQNYSNNEIFIRMPNVTINNSDDTQNIFVPAYTPYGQRVVRGQLVRDGVALNQIIRDQSAKHLPLPTVGVNDVFYVQKLAPQNSIYAMILLDKRNDKLRRIKMRDLKDLTIEVPFIRLDNSGRFVAKLVVDENQNGKIEIDKNSSASAYGLYYIGKGKDSLTSSEAAALSYALDDCYSRSVASHVHGRYQNTKNLIGIAIFLDSTGKYLSYKVGPSSDDEMLEKDAKAVALSMKKCSVPELKGKITENKTEPQHIFIGMIGDAAAVQMASEGIGYYWSMVEVVNRKLSDDDKQLCLGKAKPKFVIKIDQNGNITNIHPTKTTLAGPCTEAVQKAMLASSPLPQPPPRIQKQLPKAEFVFNFDKILGPDAEQQQKPGDPDPKLNALLQHIDNQLRQKAEKTGEVK